MAEDYVLFSAVSVGGGAGPIVLSAVLTPPDAPTGGVLQTDSYSGSWYQTFSLLPLPESGNIYVLLHTASGFYVRAMGPDQPMQVLPFVPFDLNFYFNVNGSGPQNLVLNTYAGPSQCLTVAGSNWQPGGAVISSDFQQGAAGCLWQLLPVDRHNST